MKSRWLIFLALVAAVSAVIPGMKFYFVMADLLLDSNVLSNYSVTSSNAVRAVPLSFGLVCGLFPLALIFISRYTHSTGFRKNVIIGLWILLFMVAGLALRFWMLSSSMDKLSRIPKEIAVPNLNIEDMKFDLYLLGGLIIGSLMAYQYAKKRTTIESSL